MTQQKVLVDGTAERAFQILRQPDDITCGPTCLHSIYQYYSDPITLPQVIKEVPMLEGGGTLGVQLACHALQRGYQAWLYTYNLTIFDPSWWALSSEELAQKLEAQMRYKRAKKLHVASRAYVDFLKLGGKIKFHDLGAALIGEHLLQGLPILTGLSATYLYKSTREYGVYPVSDDLRGVPQGHFVVLTSYDPDDNSVTIADPYHPEHNREGATYRINMEHLVCAILLGIVTYDGNLLVITKS